MNLIDTIIRIEEDRKHEAYVDPLTKAEPWTIGEGHTGPEVHEGLVWNDAQIDAAKALDIMHATNGCLAHFPWFSTLDPVRYAVMQSLAFQLGIPRLLGFVHFLGAMRDQRWNAAAGELRDSALYKQAHARTERAARAIETGETQWA
jgi:GH24 family phage-related lysozyme (muramidase)